MVRGNLLRAFVQVARPGVIAQPGPMLDDRQLIFQDPIVLELDKIPY
jgi:hypothetical protein